MLTYGLQCIDVSKKSLSSLEKIQSKLLKVAVGVHKFCKSTPILGAMNVHKIETTLHASRLELIRNMLKSSSRARSFYMYLLNLHVCDELSSHNNLISRTSQACDRYNISFIRYVLDDNYSKSSQRKIKAFPENDGVVDSVRQLLLNKDPYNTMVLNMMLIPF